jgi:hypothetical protein
LKNHCSLFAGIIRNGGENICIPSLHKMRETRREHTNFKKTFFQSIRSFFLSLASPIKNFFLIFIKSFDIEIDIAMVV